MSPVAWGDIFTSPLRGDRIMELRHGFTESRHTRAILRYTLPTYVSTIASEFAENGNFWSHYGCSSVLAWLCFVPAGQHSRSAQGANPPVCVSVVLQGYSAGQVVRL